MKAQVDDCQDFDLHNASLTIQIVRSESPPAHRSLAESSSVASAEGGRLKPFSKKGKDTISIGVRYSSEMRDHFIGQLASMHMPHSRREHLYPEAGSSTDFPDVRCLLGFCTIYCILL